MSLVLRDLEEGGGESQPGLWRDASLAASCRSVEAPLPRGTRRLVALRDGRPVGRVAFNARSGFTAVVGTTGYVGWYAAADPESGAALLREAVGRLMSAGADRVVGPMDGSTWYRYRVTLPRTADIANGGAFLSEPQNPAEWPEHFAAAGFRPLLEYETRRVAEPMPAATLAPRRAELTSRGVRLRSLSMDRYDAELAALFELSLEAFAENPFYTPISFDEFKRLYAPLRPVLDPTLIRLAEDDRGKLLGYVFAFPDALASRDRPRIVLKTLAVGRCARGWGLGAVLTDEVHTAAAERGASVLHALMQVSNASRAISRHSESELFRRYVLYGLGAP